MQQTGQTTTSPPDWLLQPIKDNVAKAKEIADAPYQEYDGQRIADFTDDQMAAFDEVRKALGYGQGDIADATGGLKSLLNYDPSSVQAKTFDSATASEYMNPYVENVLDRARSRAFETQDIADQKRAAKQIAGGAFGDNTRRGVEDATAADDFQTRLLDMEAKQLAKAYESGANIFAKDADRELTADKIEQSGMNALGNVAKGIGALASTGQNMNTAGIDALMKIGGIQEAKDQGGLDLAYGDFLAQTNYPKEQVAFLTDILSGVPSGSQSTTFGQAPNVFGQLAGTGITGASLYGAGGGFGGGGFSMDQMFKTLYGMG